MISFTGNGNRYIYSKKETLADVYGWGKEEWKVTTEFRGRSD